MRCCANTLEIVLQEMIRDLELQAFSEDFLVPVSKKKAPDYFKVVKKPIDIHTIKVFPA
jgi:hypothetical protein